MPLRTTTSYVLGWVTTIARPRFSLQKICLFFFLLRNGKRTKECSVSDMCGRKESATRKERPRVAWLGLRQVDGSTEADLLAPSVGGLKETLVVFRWSCASMPGCSTWTFTLPPYQLNSRTMTRCFIQVEPSYAFTNMIQLDAPLNNLWRIVPSIGWALVKTLSGLVPSSTWCNDLFFFSKYNGSTRTLSNPDFTEMHIWRQFHIIMKRFF